VEPTPNRARTLTDWCFRNRQTGEITIVQSPNVPLWIFLGSVAARWVAPSGSTMRSVVDGVGVTALTWWAVDEVVRGVNPWRRFLGVGGCVVAASGVVALLR
jgi:hypothetical protein